MTIAEGYNQIAAALSRDGSMIVAMLWEPDAWSVTVGTVNEEGEWEFSDPKPVPPASFAAQAGASLYQRSDGVWEFAYTGAGSTAAARIHRCSNLASDGSGDWV